MVENASLNQIEAMHSEVHADVSVPGQGELELPLEDGLLLPPFWQVAMLQAQEQDSRGQLWREISTAKETDYD
jgi:hypothetical protein